MTRKTIGLSDIWYFIAASVLLYICQFLVLFIPFRWYIPMFKDHGKTSHEKITVAKTLIVRKALLRGLHYLPWKGKCLIQALTAKILLKMVHLPGVIYLGIAKEGNGLKAHAWLKSGNQFICGQEGHKRYTIVQEIS